MNICYQQSFKSDLAKIMKQFNDAQYSSLPEFGIKIANQIISNVENIASKVESYSQSNSFEDKVRDNFNITKIKPRVYADNGYCNSDDLFFSERTAFLGGICYIDFYIPYMFKTSDQKAELKSFTKDWVDKCNDKTNIEFFSVTFFITPPQTSF